MGNVTKNSGAEKAGIKNGDIINKLDNKDPFKGSKLFLDSDNLENLKNLSNDVKKSKVLVALLSKGYLTRPYCLLELYTAITNDIPIVPVVIVGGGYDFKNANKFLETETTLEKANKKEHLKY